MRWSRLLFTVAALGAGVEACDLASQGTLHVVDDGGIDATADGTPPPDAGTDQDAEISDGGMDAEAGPCSALHGPTMVPATTFCVDSTEVTIGQYAEFIAADASLSGLPTQCGGKTSFVPTVWTDAAAPNLPVDYVDWCDAWAFCAWAGKRLCGSLGGGPIVTSAPGQWETACSATGTRPYCYGSSWSTTDCNVRHDGGLDRAPVGSFPNCVGGYPGIFDMTGNVAEWIDRCPGSNCAYQTSDYTSTSANGGCDKQGLATNALQGLQGIGFRCCSK